MKKGANKMNTSSNTTIKIDTKVLFSTLWIVVMINMLKADILFAVHPWDATDESGENRCQRGSTIPATDASCRYHDGNSYCHDLPIPGIESSANRWANIITAIVMIVLRSGQWA